MNSNVELLLPQAQLAVDSCLALVRQLVAAARQQGSPTRVLLAVDDYNSLYGTTEYGVLTSRPDRARRRVLRAEELVLVSTAGRGRRARANGCTWNAEHGVGG